MDILLAKKKQLKAFYFIDCTSRLITLTIITLLVAVLLPLISPANTTYAYFKDLVVTCVALCKSRINFLPCFYCRNIWNCNYHDVLNTRMRQSWFSREEFQGTWLLLKEVYGMFYSTWLKEDWITQCS